MHFRSVVRHKKKFVVFLMIVAVGSGFLSIMAQSGNDKEKSKPLHFAGMQDKAGALMNDPNPAIRTTGGFGSQELFFKMMLSILLVIALGTAAIYISRKLLPKITNLPGKQIHILETAHLGPRKAVHLVRIGDQKLLIGSTNESITTLANMTGALTQFSTEQIDDSVRT